MNRGFSVTGLTVCALLSLSILFTLPLASAEEVYRSVDKDGNVVFTDQPQPGAERLEVQPVNVHTYPKVSTPKPNTTKEKDKSTGYSSIQIIAPEHDSTIRDPGDVLIRVSLRPALRMGHQLVFSDNGTPLDKPTRNSHLQLFNLSRGTHMIQVAVVDQSNKVLLNSEAIAVHVHRGKIPLPKPASGS